MEWNVSDYRINRGCIQLFFNTQTWEVFLYICDPMQVNEANEANVNIELLIPW